VGKLKSLRSGIAPLAPRVGFIPGDEKAQDKSRNNAAPWRAWYRTERWRRLRQQAFVRDHYRCQRTGELCAGRYPAPNSPVANHKTPHRGNPDLFWDIDNIETVTKAVHDGLIQSDEQAVPRGKWD
jgi:5-methylcytosine-specific restriction protein A